MNPTVAGDAERMWADVTTWLRETGVTTVFALPDDDMVAARALRTAEMHVEWAVSQRTLVHMATGLSLAQDRISVCVVGRGPAVAACVPALLEAYASHAPVLVLATGTSPHRRQQRAFQDAPTIEMVKPVTRWAVRIEHPRDVVGVLSRALSIMTEGAGGPVYVEMPDQTPADRGTSRCHPARVSDIDVAIARADRPLILVGAGVPRSAAAEVTALADALGAVVLATSSGRGTFPESHPGYLGLSGFYMRADTLRIVERADLVLALGSSLEETAMVGMPMEADWIQVNIAATGVNHSVPGRYLLADLGEFLPAAPTPARSSWAADALGQRSMRPPAKSRCARVLAHLARLLPDGVVVHENGLHDMWSYEVGSWTLSPESIDVAPSEMSTLGFGVAAALGIAAASDAPVVTFVGDAAFSTILGDLPAFLNRPLRLLYVVFDDGGLGWLDREARKAGLDSHYRWNSPLAMLGALEVLIELDDDDGNDDERQSVERAVARASSGRITVLRVPCDPDDVPPFLHASEERR